MNMAPGWKATVDAWLKNMVFTSAESYAPWMTRYKQYADMFSFCCCFFFTFAFLATIALHCIGIVWIFFFPSVKPKNGYVTGASIDTALSKTTG